MRTNYSFGLHKSPKDSRDYLMESFLEKKELPKRYDITEKMTPVRDQKNEGACVGFAMSVGVKEYLDQIDYGIHIELSPRFLYEEAKKRSGHKEGTTLRAAMRVAKNLGVCEESFWPYIPKETLSPAPNTYKNAEKFKIKAYARIMNLKELKESLIQFGAILIGVKVFKGMLSDKAKETGIVPDPSCWQRSLGGHALCVVAYNDNSPYYKDGHVKVKNSWGQFGDSGYLYLSYKYIKNNMLDAFSCVDVEDPFPYVRTVTHLYHWQRKGLWV